MFRRKEDGSDPIEATNDNHSADGAASHQATSAAPAPTPAAPSPVASAPAPSPVSMPQASMTPAAAQPSTPAFRPVPPQAAMAAAQRAQQVSTPAPAPVAHTPAPTPAPAADRLPASPVSRPNAKRVLTVGPDIQMKGEVTSCDRVIIEGTVDATMRDVHTVELAETGSLKGTAEVEDAEISGSFEGDLVVRGRLTVYASGRVRGNVTYGEIEIQRGGQISGNIRNVADAKQGQQPQHAKKAA